MADFLKAVGLLAWCGGAWLLYTGFGMNVLVTTADGPVANLQLMHIQQLDLLLGALALIFGGIGLVGGLILDRMPEPPKTGA